MSQGDDGKRPRPNVAAKTLIGMAAPLPPRPEAEPPQKATEQRAPAGPPAKQAFGGTMVMPPEAPAAPNAFRGTAVMPPATTSPGGFSSPAAPAPEQPAPTQEPVPPAAAQQQPAAPPAGQPQPPQGHGYQATPPPTGHLPPPPYAPPAPAPQAVAPDPFPNDYAPANTEPSGGRSRGKAMVIVGVVVGGALLLLIAAGVVTYLRQRAEAPTAAPTTSAPAAASAAAAASASAKAPEQGPRTCDSGSDAKQLSKVVYRRVEPVLAATSGGVAVGFAADASTSVGLMVTPASLAVEERHRETGGQVTSVVPVDGEALRFDVLRDRFPLGPARIVPAETSFAIGQLGQHFARADLEKPNPEVIWKFVGKITAPSVAVVPGEGVAVAFRSGGQSGEVRVGWLDLEGKQKTELGTVATDAAFVGTPALTASKAGVVVAFATRKSAEEPWGLATATAPAGTLPESATPFEPPAGGPGGMAISPALASFENGDVMFQWTEGTNGAFRVRAQLMSSTLEPKGDAFFVSPEDANAGQGNAWAHGDKALLAFIVATDDGDELWAKSLLCTGTE